MAIANLTAYSSASTPASVRGGLTVLDIAATQSAPAKLDWKAVEELTGVPIVDGRAHVNGRYILFIAHGCSDSGKPHWMPRGEKEASVAAVRAGNCEHIHVWWHAGRPVKCWAAARDKWYGSKWKGEPALADVVKATVRALTSLPSPAESDMLAGETYLEHLARLHAAKGK